MAPLAEAARCRSESDWLIGINGTRAITKRMFGSRAGNVAAVGRVQTPTLAIVFARELEIRTFKPRAYWRVTAQFGITRGAYEGVYQRPNFKRTENDEHDRIDRIWERAEAEAIVAACQGQPPADGQRGEEGLHPGCAAPLRPDHACSARRTTASAFPPAARSRSPRPSTSGTR